MYKRQLVTSFDTDGFVAVVVPVTADGVVARITSVAEGDLRCSGRIRITKIEAARRAPINTDGLVAVTVPVTEERQVAAVALVEVKVGCPLRRCLPHVEADPALDSGP